MKVILASASPRRKELLGQLIEDFEIIPADINEDQVYFKGEGIKSALNTVLN